MRLPDVGEVFEGYELLRILGEGGFARVFLARDTRVQREVALKVLMPQSEGGTTRLRFLREANVIAGLRDPHTITLFDFGASDDGVLFMACEYIAGEDLSTLLRREGPVGPAATVRILEQLLSSLREAHDAGILHRDVKPANILVYEYDGDPYRVKLLDFGLARPPRDPDGTMLTRQGNAVGTPRYMSPEQVGGGQLDRRTDIYSLGLVAFELLTGQPAIDGPDPRALMQAQLGGPPIRIPTDAAPARLRRIIEKMVERDLRQRYAGVEQVRQDLRYLKNKTGGVQVVEATPRTGWVAATIALIAVVAAAWVAFGMGTDQPAPPPVQSVSRNAVPNPAPVSAMQPTEAAKIDLGIAPAASDAGAADVAAASGSPGCGRTPPFTGRGTLSAIDGFTRQSWVTFIPSDYDPAREHTALVLLHTDARDPPEFIDQLAIEDKAEEQSLILIVPDGGLLPWREPATILAATRTAVEATAERLCLDRNRVFGIGHGAGGKAIEYLACDGWLAGFAMVDYRSTNERLNCKEYQPVPSIRFVPTTSNRFPLRGGKGCGGGMSISLEDAKQRWRSINGCEEASRRVFDRAGADVCWTWDCEEPLIACMLVGGHSWPGSKMHDTEIIPCDKKLMTYPATEATLEFFSSLPSKTPRESLW